MFKKAIVSLAALLVISGCATKEGAIDNPSNSGASALNIQAKMVSYINSIRQKGAMCAPPTKPLAYSGALERSAQSHAKDMALNNKLSHIGSGTATDPAKKALGVGSTHVERALYFGYPTKKGYLLGEDIGYAKFSVTKTQDYYANFKEVINNFIHDRAHCEILMNPKFDNIGMGMYKTDDRYYFVMDLGEKLK